MVGVIGAAAAFWGLLMALAPLLQIRRMLRRRSADDVSIGYFLVLAPGFVLWIVYGAVVRDPFLVVPNVAAVLMTAVTVTVAVLLKRRAPG